MCKLTRASLRWTHFYKVYSHLYPPSHSPGTHSSVLLHIRDTHTSSATAFPNYISMQSSVDRFSMKTLLLTLQASLLLQEMDGIIQDHMILCIHSVKIGPIAIYYFNTFARSLPSRLCSLRASSVLPLPSEDFKTDFAFPFLFLQKWQVAFKIHLIELHPLFTWAP